MALESSADGPGAQVPPAGSERRNAAPRGRIEVMVELRQNGGRKRYLDYHARCHQAFTPFAPIELPDFFAGRLDVVRRVLGELTAPGRQVAIFGERGVGKTSLAYLLSFFSHFEPVHSYIVHCGRDSTFESIFYELLQWHGSSLSLDSVERGATTGGGIEAGPVRAGGSRRQQQTFRTPTHAHRISARRVLDAFSQTDALLIIDEFDRVQDDETHRRVAELVKAFSDSRSRSKLVIVGVADSVRDLIGEHTSLNRSLAQIKLDRMDRGELTDVIRRGEERTGVTFQDSVVRRIVSLADGFPHFVHLISLYASLSAIEPLLEDPEAEPRVVDEREYDTGVAEAIQNSEYTLAEAYDNAVITTRRQSDIYELTLQAIAMGEDPVAQVQEIALHASTLASRSVKPAQLSTALGRRTHDNKGRVLTKVRDGYYKFTNPLLRAYVRMLLDQRYRGQLRLPFFE